MAAESTIPARAAAPVRAHTSTVDEALARELRRLGVEAVFGLTGEDTIKLGVELGRRGIAYYGARDESVAVGMADGYARVSGGLGVALVSRGPGLTHALSGLATAARARSAVLVLAGDADARARHPKYVDQELVLAGAGIPSATLDDPASAVADLAALHELARRGATIVANLRGDLLEQEAGRETARVLLPQMPPAPGAPDAAAIAEIADLLQEGWAARRPVVLAGRGALRAGTALRRLADRCGALLATTLMARSLFADDPFDLGIAGSFVTPPAAELLAGADLVLAFGTSLNPLTTLRGQLFPRATLVRFDADPSAEEAGSVPAAAFVLGDARRAAEALADELERRGHRGTGYRTREVAARLAEFDAAGGVVDRGDAHGLDPRLVNARLDAVLPRDRAVVVDVGHHMAFPTEFLTTPDARSFLAPLDFWCVGSATGVALGAAIARRDRPTVLCIGDLGMLMTLGDLETAVRYELPLLVVVANDRAFGAELHHLRLAGWPDDAARFPTPSFAAVAQALGADALAVGALSDLDELRGRAGDLRRPLLVECPVTTEVRSASFELVAGGNLLEGWREPAWREPRVDLATSPNIGYTDRCSRPAGRRPTSC